MLSGIPYSWRLYTPVTVLLFCGVDVSASISLQQGHYRTLSIYLPTYIMCTCAYMQREGRK